MSNETEVGLLRIAPGGTIVAANFAAACLFGFESPAELVAEAERSEGRMCLFENDERLDFSRLVMSAEPVALEAGCQRRDKSSWRCRIMALPVRGPSGEPIEVALLLEDVSRRAACEARRERELAERKKAEENIRESEKRFRLLADAMPQIVWIVRADDGALEYINVKWTEYTGQSQSEVDVKSLETYVHPMDLPATLARWNSSCASGLPFESECRVRRRDGAYRWHLLRALAVRAVGGEIVHWFGTATDIEDERRQQEALREEDRRKNDFLALLGHELRNPLTPIRTGIALLQRAGQSEAVFQRARAIIDRQVVQMTRLIDDLLDVSRISRCKMLLRKQRIDLVDLVRTTLSDRMENFQVRGLTVEATLPRHSIFITADPARLAQAVGNLLDNAEKFTNSGGKISVVMKCDADECGVRIDVADTGIGMSDVTLAHAFVPFAQAEQNQERRQGGLGLGLSLVRGLIELHQGAVTASSEGEGRGSVFTIWLPLCACVDEEERLSFPPSGTRKPRRILVVEDNRDAAETLELALSMVGHEVLVATSGEEAVTRALAFRPSVVLSDIGLPGKMSGYDVARALREDRATAATYLVAITGYGQDEDRRRAFEAGFDRHLTKPFDIASLELMIDEIAEDTRLPGEDRS